ncbi:MAG: bifunctional oligoribonuclease/PAP phosphatase NrnA [Candidatus Omnitrophota bacterium]
MHRLKPHKIGHYQSVAKAIRKSRRIAICAHMFPDGDALGSMTGLAQILRRLNKKVVMFSPSPLPKRYRFLPEYLRIRRHESGSGPFDLAIAVDCASYVQLGEFYEKIFRKTAVTIEIDHHTFRKPFAGLTLVDDKAAAVGEMIYYLSRLLRVSIDQETAVSLLVSIIVETGSFRLPTISAETFEICAELLSKGVDYYGLVEKSYWSRSRQEATLLGLCFSRIRFLSGGKLADTYVTLGDLKRLGASDEDVDPIADQIRTLKEVKVVLMSREMAGGRWRISLRSKGRVNVGEIAEEFGGGGHPDVAGCFIGGSTAEKKALIKRIQKEF